ncbi:MAG: helix-turn-helix domain-containing protein [Flavobacteriaceae bacterium]|nr:helix-turn-helix domain-containing protein [Flavobacteriaceae bacterium]
MEKREILPEELWNDDKKNKINQFVKNHSKDATKERKLRNKLLAIQYQIEDYIEDNETKEDEVIELLDFVKMYLKALNITKKELAKYFGMLDSNLHKYLTGKRKLSPEIVLKISSFSRTKPEYWYRIQTKNELIKLKKEDIKKYDKYDYEGLVTI